MLEVATLGSRRIRALLRLGPPTAGAAVVLTDADARVLLVRTSYRRHWTVPGGFLNLGESAAAAAVRELSEELGVTSVSLHPTGEVPGPSRHTTHVFVGTAAPDDVTGHSWEIRQHAWFKTDALPRLGASAEALLRRSAG